MCDLIKIRLKRRDENGSGLDGFRRNLDVTQDTFYRFIILMKLVFLKSFVDVLLKFF